MPGACTRVLQGYPSSQLLCNLCQLSRFEPCKREGVLHGMLLTGQTV